MEQEKLDQLNSDEIGKLFPIILSAPKQNWKKLFSKEKEILKKILGEYGLRIEHFGSTAIPNIMAKPTIDILVEIPSNRTIKEDIVNIMKRYKYYYSYRSDQKPPHIMFIKGVSSSGVTGQTYHIHMAERENRNLWDRLYFRDYLIENPKLAEDYENLKRELAKKYKHDRDAYTSGKTEFITKTTSEARKKYNIAK